MDENTLKLFFNISFVIFIFALETLNGTSAVITSSCASVSLPRGGAEARLGLGL